MIIELFGLPGSGKTALADALQAKGAVLAPLPSRVRLIFDSCLFWLSHPVLAVKLFWFMAAQAPRTVRYELFVNGYMGYAARFRRAQVLSRSGTTVVLDQGFFQLHISLIGLPSALLERLLRPDLLVVVTADASVREERMAARGWAPRRDLGTEARLAWQERAEAAFDAVLPSLKKSVQTYRYDGTQDPEVGAAVLMEFIAEQVSATAHVSFLRNLFKTTLFGTSFLLAQAARVFRRSPQVVVLMYHAVDNSGWKLSVSPETFERQMKYLAWKGWAVSLVDVVSYTRGEKKLFAHAVAVTFDDGYRDLLTAILPILERYRIPATVFVPSDLSVQTDPSGRTRLNEEEICALARSPLITIGSHAVTHRKFTNLSREEMKSEAEESAKALAHISGAQPHFFAYPFGARSREAECVIKDAGYEAAFGITEGMIHQGDNLFRLKRVQIDGTMSFLLFRLRLTSAVDWNRRIVDVFRARMLI